MKLLVTLAVVALIAMAIVEARPPRRDNRRAGSRGPPGGGAGASGRGPGRDRSRQSGDYRGHRSRPRGVIACKRTEIAGGVETVIEDEIDRCPAEYPCTVKGLQVTIDSKINEISFCNTPFPSPKMACKIKNADGTTRDERKSCSEDEECTAEYQGKDRFGNDISYFICVPVGTTTNPTKPDYAQILLRRACSIDGQGNRNCSRKGQCDGIQLTVDGKQLQFCQRNDSSEEVGGESDILSLFKGKCGRKGGRRDSSSSSDDDEESTDDDSPSSEEGHDRPVIPFRQGSDQRSPSRAGGRNVGRNGNRYGGNR